MILIRTVDPRHRAKDMAKAHLKQVTPATVKRTVTPRRRPNAKLRTREYMTEAEVNRLMAAAKGNPYGHRDATMALVAYRHGPKSVRIGRPAADAVQGFFADVSCFPSADDKAFAVGLVYSRRRSLRVFGCRDCVAEHSTAEINGSATHEKKRP